MSLYKGDFQAFLETRSFIQYFATTHYSCLFSALSIVLGSAKIPNKCETVATHFIQKWPNAPLSSAQSFLMENPTHTMSVRLINTRLI